MHRLGWLEWPYCARDKYDQGDVEARREEMLEARSVARSEASEERSDNQQGRFDYAGC